MFLSTVLGGCYSFTGGSVPDYLKTIYISPVTDNSGYGNPNYKESLTTLLVERFRSDNTFSIVESGGDAKLYVKISSVTDSPQTIKPGGELEKERKITITCNTEYYDGVKKKTVWKKDFTNYNLYDIGGGQAGRDEAIRIALEQIADDILLAVVSGW